MTEASREREVARSTALEELATLAVLPTDESLIANLGHLTPLEIQHLDIKKAHKARIAQLQMEALHYVRDNGGELLGWLACYHSTFSKDEDYV